MIKYIFIAAGLLFPYVSFAQTITGTVLNKQREALANASVSWLHADIMVRTDTAGYFEIPFTGNNQNILIVSHTGYKTDTVLVFDQAIIECVLQQLGDMSEIVVSRPAEGIVNSNRNPFKVEQLTKGELIKAACCDLAGCFETQLTVQPQTTNVITNSKELRILGLSGVYNQILIDGFPMIQGMTYTYGVSSIPGTLVNNIYVSKGANSVLQGYESISGQINVETVKPGHTDKLLVNGYVNSFLEKHLNVNYNYSGRKWSNLTAFHTVQPSNRIDRDKDNFLDLPLLTRYMAYNRIKYGRETDWGWSGSLSVRLLKEQRVGGQTSFRRTDKGSSTVYGQMIDLNQPELMMKTGYRFNDVHNVVLNVSTFHHQQQSYFGTLEYNARQSNLYINLQHEWKWKTHDWRSGVSFRHLNITEDIRFADDLLNRGYAGVYRREENIPGVFTETTMRFLGDKLTWIAGARADKHNEFGTIATPRTLIKYDFTPETVIRANVGFGWRTVNFFSENIGLLASSRDILFLEPLKPEKAINSGINVTHKFLSANSRFSGSISVDYYHTRFSNQIFPDYDADPTKALVRNFTGKSVSNGFQSELYLQFLQQIDLRMGYNFLEVYQGTGALKKILPFNPRHKFLTALSYKPVNKRFQADINLHWFGRQRLPDTKLNPPAYQRPDSQPYTTVNIQFTYNLKKLELYAGCENVFNFRQHQPIISWQNPFGPYFDTSSVWGPTRGREFYLGFRFRIPKNG